MEPGGFGSAHLDRAAGRRQDRHHPGRQVGLVRRLHPEPGDGRDDRRRQPVGQPIPLAARPSAAPTSRARPARASPARCGATRCRRSSSGCPTRLRRARPPASSRASRPPCPSPDRAERRDRPSARCARPASPPLVGGYQSTPATPTGTVAYTSPGPADAWPQGRHGHDLPVDRPRPAPPPEAGGGGNGGGDGNGGGNGGGGTAAATAAARRRRRQRPAVGCRGLEPLTPAGGVPPRRRRRRRRGP